MDNDQKLDINDPDVISTALENGSPNDFGVSDADWAEMNGEDYYYEEYDPWNDPDWEPPCDCWCELCGCHGYCMEDYEGDDLDDDEYDEESDPDI